MRVRIENVDSEPWSGPQSTITVRRHRCDAPLAEPESLHNEFDLHPGESGIVEIHAGSVITVTEANHG